ncbi:hypothetical protein J2X47_001964 [Sphingomonas sp. BE270]|jgi:hypothetical protein|nr:hypothetical protein [Sphingomonas sp. BE270]
MASNLLQFPARAANPNVEHLIDFRCWDDGRDIGTEYHAGMSDVDEAILHCRGSAAELATLEPGTAAYERCALRHRWWSKELRYQVLAEASNVVVLAFALRTA